MKGIYCVWMQRLWCWSTAGTNEAYSTGKDEALIMLASYMAPVLILLSLCGLFCWLCHCFGSLPARLSACNRSYLYHIYMNRLVKFDLLLLLDFWSSGSHMTWQSLCLVGSYQAFFVIVVEVCHVWFGYLVWLSLYKCKSLLNHWNSWVGSPKLQKKALVNFIMVFLWILGKELCNLVLIIGIIKCLKKFKPK